MSGTFQHPVQRSTDTSPGTQSLQIRPTRTMANAAILAAGALTAVSAGASITAFSAQATIQDVLAGAPAPEVMAYDVFGIAYTALWVVAGIAATTWLVRARANSERISTLRHERSRVWCWLAWCVPVVSFWFPRQVVRDVHRASSRDLSAPRDLNRWWGLFVAALLVSQAADRFALGGDHEYLSWLGPLNAISTVLMIGAFIFWARIVTAVVRLQEARVPPAA